MDKNSGFLLIDKLRGLSSHGVINYLRQVTGIRRIGHAGTLDPMATGLLVVAVGRETTKTINQFVKVDKEYQAEILLGRETDSYDITGKTTNEYQGEAKSEVEIKVILARFVGVQDQFPPMYSAKKVNGRKLYQIALEKQEIILKSSQIEIYDIKLIKYEWPHLEIIVSCSSGTYVRSLAHDLGEILGCGACLEGLRRTKISTFKVEDAYLVSDVNEENWRKLLF
jgi:tRNA pseudouridine55 synthase